MAAGRGGCYRLPCRWVVLCARTATAETLNEALSNTYLINPVLNSERARQRGTDEQVAVAISGLRPNISASGDAAFRNQEFDVVGGSRSKFQTCDMTTRGNEPAFCAFLDATASAAARPTALPDDGVTHPYGYSVTLSQPIFEGFQNSSTPSARRKPRCKPAARACARWSRPRF